MTHLRHILSLSILLTLIVARPALGADYQQFRTPTGTLIDYAVVLPADIDPAKTYPAILAFPPGPQTKSMVDVGLQSYWEQQASSRGFIVVSPSAPNGVLFFQGSETEIPALLAHLRATLPIAPDGFHVAGLSNGGLSAFRVALAQPAEFQSLTVLPGYPPSQQEWENLASLDGIAINMFVGAIDASWRRNMERTVAELERLGQTPHFEILPAEGRVLRGIAGPGANRIFDLLQN